MRATRSIYRRLLLPFAAAVIVAIFGAWWVASAVLSETLEQRVTAQLARAAEVLDTGGLPLTPALLTRIATLIGADVVLLRDDGSVALSTLPQPQQVIDTVASAVTDGRSVITRINGQKLSVVSRRISRDGDPRYHQLLVVGSMADAQQASRRAAGLLGLAALASTLLLAAAGHRLISGITKPIVSLAGLADRIADGNFDARVSARGQDEVAMLTRGLNRMAERLKVYQAEATLRSRTLALGELATQVAHEVRNPLTAIKLQLQLLEESSTDEDRLRIARVLDEVRRLELIVTGTLASARPGALRLAPVDLRVLLDEFSALIKPQLDHQGIDLECRVAAIPAMQLDADRIRQILFNLTNNASGILSSGGTLRISVRPAAGSSNVVEMTVEDSGPGIALDGSERPEAQAGGTGLGLRLCRELAGEHGGGLEIGRSPDLGGARIVVTLAAGDVVV